MTQEPAPGTDATVRKRRRTLWWTLGTIGVLALVIFGASALSDPKDSGTGQAVVPASPTSGDEQSPSELLYEQALKAQRAGETTRALELARDAVEVDPGNEKAVRLTATLSGAESPAPGSKGPSTASSGAATTTPATTEASTAAAPVQRRVAEIDTLLPVAVDGYSLGTPQADSGNAVVSADPNRGSADQRAVVTALLSVHDRESEKAARQWVSALARRVYPKNSATVMIAGSQGLFGTDGRRLAWIGFSRGPYAFEVAVTVPANPASAKAIALKLASAFPVTN